MNKDFTPETIARRKIKSRWHSIKKTAKKYLASTNEGARELLKGHLDRGVESYRRHVAELAGMPHRADKESDTTFIQPADQANVATARLDKFLADNKIQA